MAKVTKADLIKRLEEATAEKAHLYGKIDGLRGTIAELESRIDHLIYPEDTYAHPKAATTQRS